MRTEIFKHKFNLIINYIKLTLEEISSLKNNYFTSVMGEKYLNLKSRQPKKMSGLAYESMKAKVCKKYAKFE